MGKTQRIASGDFSNSAPAATKTARAAFSNVRHVDEFLSNSPRNFEDFVARVGYAR